MRRGHPAGAAGGLPGHRRDLVLPAGQLRLPARRGKRRRSGDAVRAESVGAAGGGGHRPDHGGDFCLDPRPAGGAAVADRGHPPDPGREAPGSGGQDIPPDGKALRLLRDVGRQELQTQPQALPVHGGGIVPQRDAVHLGFVLLRLPDGRGNAAQLRRDGGCSCITARPCRRM